MALVAALAVMVAGTTAAAGAADKRGKIKACVAKRGPDKGLMRFARGKCKHGERKVTWNKKGKPGPAGQNGAAGPTNEDLLALIQQQATQIEELTSSSTASCLRWLRSAPRPRFSPTRPTAC